MDKTIVEDKHQPNGDDFRGLATGPEQGFADLVAALTRGLTDVIFNDLTAASPPLSGTDSSGDLAIVVPQTWAGVDGSGISSPHGPITGAVPVVAASLVTTVPSGANVGYQTRAFLIATKTPTTGTRRKKDGTLTQNPDAIVGEVTTARIEYTVDSGGSAPNPTLGSGDFGFIELARWDVTAGPTITQTFDPGSLIWVFAGSGIATAAHASTHLPGGSDPIPLATTVQTGLLDKDLVEFLLGAVQAVTSANSFLSVATTPTSGSNEDGPVTKQLTLAHDGSLTTTAGDKLGLNFLSGGTKGTSVRPARSDHTHVESELPFTQGELAIAGSSLVSVESLTVPLTGLSRVDNVELFWRPRKTGEAVGSTTYPLIRVPDTYWTFTVDSASSIVIRRGTTQGGAGAGPGTFTFFADLGRGDEDARLEAAGFKFAKSGSIAIAGSSGTDEDSELVLRVSGVKA